jgi:hypothetical protein
MLLQVEAREKRAHRFRSHSALETKVIEDRDHQADEPSVAVFGFSKPGLGILISAGHSPPQPMHTAFGESGLTGDLANARVGVIPKGVENQAAFGPKVGSKTGAVAVGPGSSGLPAAFA